MKYSLSLGTAFKFLVSMLAVSSAYFFAKSFKRIGASPSRLGMATARDTAEQAIKSNNIMVRSDFLHLRLDLVTVAHMCVK